MRKKLQVDSSGTVNYGGLYLSFTIYYFKTRYIIKRKFKQ